MATKKTTTTTTTRKPAARKPATATKKPTTPARKPATPKVVVQTVELTETSPVHDILAAVSVEKTNEKKVEILQRYNANFIKSILIWNFDESILSDLPPGEVPLTAKEDADQRPGSNLRKEWDKLYNFVKGGNDAMNKLRKETMFINILETLHPSEAEILILVKDKNLQSKYSITKELVSEAYPDIQWGNRS
jgi:hypothetical protein